MLDVREDAEWAAGHAPSAHHVPMNEVPARIAEIPEAGPVVVVCRVGGRSAEVVRYLAAQGYGEVLNLDGGMQAWASAGRPLEADGAGIPTIV